MGFEFSFCENIKEGLALGALWQWGRVDAGTFRQLSSFGHQGPNSLEGWLGESLGLLFSILLEA